MDSLVAVSYDLRTLCRHSYGPNGEEVLVFAPPNAPLITSDGHTVLRARRQQDEAVRRSPFERVILDAAEGVYREVGDGTVQFVLLLHGVLAHLADHGVGNAASRVRMARALGALRHQWDAHKLLGDRQNEVVIEELVTLERGANNEFLSSAKLLTRLNDVLTTALTGFLGRQALLQIVRLILQWVFQQPLRLNQQSRGPLWHLHRRLQSFIRHAPDAVIHAHGSTFKASFTVPSDEFIMRKSLIPSQLPRMLIGGTKIVRFVCLIGSLDAASGSNPIVYTATPERDPSSAVDGLRRVTNQFLIELREQLDVRLIVTTEKVDDHVAATCSQLQIACVQYAEREDVESLCSIAGIYPLASAFDAIDKARHVGVCENGASVTRQSQTPSIHLRGIRRRESTTAHEEHIPQLVIYAPSKGVFKQYYNTVLKGLRVLRSAFTVSTHGSPTIRLCLGAGAAELTIAKILQTQEGTMAAKGGDPSILLASRALSTALVETVAQLRANINRVGNSRILAASSDRQSSRILLDEMSRLGLASTECEGARGYILDMNHVITTRLGSVVAPTLVTGDPLERSVIHPWQRIETIVHTVLQTAEMLLRVDAILRVKRDPIRQRTGLHEAQDDGGNDN